MFSHWESTCSRPKQFCSLHQECLMLLQQHMLFQPQLYVEPSNRDKNVRIKYPNHIFKFENLLYLSATSITKVYRKVKCTTNCNSVTAFIIKKIFIQTIIMIIIGKFNYTIFPAFLPPRYLSLDTVIKQNSTC